MSVSKSNIFECVVVGKGLVGSAAARHLQNLIGNVAVIGPDEPKDYNASSVFASHYDQGRVQRIIGVDPVWTLLNQRSAMRYPMLEKESGIQFHTPVGCLYVSHVGKDEYVDNVPTQAQKFNTGYQFLNSGDEIHKCLPAYNFPNQAFGVLENGPAGYINPMNLVQAQLALFNKQGGVTLTDTVSSVRKSGSEYEVDIESGETLRANRVLITAGAFSNFHSLIPKPLDLFMKSETVLLAQVSSAEVLRLKNLPSLLYEIDNGSVEGIYAVPPVIYPDGNIYFKIGCNLPSDIVFTELAEIQEWFRHGDSDANIPAIRDALNVIMPDLKVEKFKSKRCLISRTKTKKAYIGRADDHQLFVAAGGNGYTAMCSEATGEIAAHFTVHGVGSEGFNIEDFKPVFN
ncbi:MAG: FAD-binding oxidoreductase [Cyclobacteriaceae bacterium]|nr:FAD-binding oxidoreductase [Cyclobacteriaceae bacterium]